MAGLVTWWLARTEDQLPPPAGWLSEAEHAYAASLRYPKRRTDFLLSRWTLKLAARQVLGWPEDTAALARIEARPAPGGAPRLLVDGQAAPHGISLTDRAGAAVCLVAAQPAAVGCDVEVSEPRSDAFIRDYLTAAEQEFVNGAGASRDTLANLVWSAKESALKVLGTGLRRDTRSVEVSITDPAPPPGTWSPLRVRTQEGDTFPGWWRRSGAFVLTACWPGGGPPPAALDPAPPLDTTAPSHRWLGRPLS
ncbi:MAG: 4'-phosphopantetheinyl transferase family protein [Gemmatimonadota bacterium]